jgi:formylglycine-generating enzyme required for sulfatase activity
MLIKKLLSLFMIANSITLFCQSDSIYLPQPPTEEIHNSGNSNDSVEVVNKATAPFEPETVFVQGSTFAMGSVSVEKNEQPVHQVTLTDFYIGKFELTQAQWRAVTDSNPSYFKGCDQCPVEHVSWDDVQQFITTLNDKTGKNYRLPTEAEWEYAARGGSKSQGFTYSGGNDLDLVAWHNGNNGSKTYAVGKKRANELGIYDMSGNVWEFCSDWHGSYSSSDEVNPNGIYSGRNRVIRGGGWERHQGYCRSAFRGKIAPDFRINTLGFRLVLDSKE